MSALNLALCSTVQCPAGVGRLRVCCRGCLASRVRLLTLASGKLAALHPCGSYMETHSFICVVKQKISCLLPGMCYHGAER